jgi:hypothetical protein
MEREQSSGAETQLPSSIAAQSVLSRCVRSPLAFDRRSRTIEEQVHDEPVGRRSARARAHRVGLNLHAVSIEGHAADEADERATQEVEGLSWWVVDGGRGQRDPAGGEEQQAPKDLPPALLVAKTRVEHGT